MKNNLLLGIGIGLTALACPQADALVLDYSSVVDSFIQFNGVAGTFSFNAPTQTEFMITASDAVGDSIGDHGWFTGVYNVAALTPSSALVTTIGTVTIQDHGGQDLVAHFLNFMNVNASGTDVHLNQLGTPNMFNITYSGGESDLQSLATYLDQTLVLSASSLSYFADRSHAPATLVDLFQGGRTFLTGFSGQISAGAVPDGGLTILLLGGAISALGFVQRRMAWL